MLNSVVMLTFSVLDRKYISWVNLVQKIETVSLSWNLAPRLIQIWRTQWQCSHFLFLTRNILSGQIWSQNSNYLVKLSTQTSSNLQNSIEISIESVFNWKYSFRKIWSKKRILGCVYFFRFWPTSFAQKVHLTFWCHLINLRAVYS